MQFTVRVFNETLVHLYITMCSSYKAINITKQSDISNNELSIFLNNISKEALVDYLIYSIKYQKIK